MRFGLSRLWQRHIANYNDRKLAFKRQRRDEPRCRRDSKKGKRPAPLKRTPADASMAKGDELTARRSPPKRTEPLWVTLAG